MVDILETTFSNAFFWDENHNSLISISQAFVAEGAIDISSTSDQVTPWRQTGDKAS